jgi:hypothetical protein
MRDASTRVLVLGLGLAGCLPLSEKSERELVETRDRLLAQKQHLEAELRAEVKDLVVVPERLTNELEVATAVPNVLVEEIIEQTVTEGFDELSFRIRNLEVRAETNLQISPLGAKLTLAHLELDIEILDVKGKASAGTPKVSVGRGLIWARIPLKIDGGEGRARIRFRWSGRGLAEAVCGDLDVSLELNGAVAPIETATEGEVGFEVVNSEFVVKPAVPQQTFLLVLEPSEESWKRVEEILNARSGVCRWVLRRVHAIERIRELLAKGIRVNIHTEKLKPIRFPISVHEEVKLEDSELELTASPALLDLGERYIWLGLHFGVARVNPE